MASKQISAKKRVVTSYTNLTPALIELLKERYPLGYTDYMIRIDKPNGEFFYGVMLETEDTNYLVKINVKIDNKSEEELDKDIYGDEEPDEIKGADEIADTDESDD